VLRWSSGVGAVDDRDLATVAQRFTDARGDPLSDVALARALDSPTGVRRACFWFDYEGNRLPVGRIRSEQAAQKFGFEPDPRPAEGEPEC
jgi:hypothetical protein